MLSRVRIVLVAPSGPANIGAVCRAMANMGLSRLVLVAPRCDPRDPAAVAYAAHGAGLLERAEIADDIPAALAGCVCTFVASSKLGLYRRQSAMTPDAAAREAFERAAGGEVAFALGREDYGFQTRELLHFDRVVTIPADPEYPVLNLAAAALIICYELRREQSRRTGQAALPMQIRQDAAPDERKRIMFEKLFDALDRVGFFFGQNPDHLKYALRHMLGRIDLTTNEADILLGLARQIGWYVDHHRRPQ
jgi:TrmH family RNA methyltransferase